jgi:hypothetical protein
MAVRRQLAHSAVAAKRRATGLAVVDRMADRLHFHGCSTCRRCLGCSCSTPQVNPVCRTCRGLTPSTYDVAREPRGCCHGNTVQVSRPEDLETYDLAGPGPWFRCQTCFRHHPTALARTP